MRRNVIFSLAFVLILVPVAANCGTVKVKVDANKGWQSTGLYVKANSLITIKAKGRWSGGPGSWCGPEGLSGMAPKIFLAPGLPSAGLVGRIGKDAPFFVGAKRSLDGRNCGTGVLKLAFNDERGGHYNNEGTIIVVIETKPAAEYETVKVKVDANKGWQRTGLYVKANSLITIKAKGRWSGGPGSWCGPEGLSGMAPKIFLAPGLPSAGLVGRIGKDAPFFVGAKRSLDGRNCGTGVLKLAFNDERGGHYNNKGTINVVIEIKTRRK